MKESSDEIRLLVLRHVTCIGDPHYEGTGAYV
jgi:hypothetical protein